jgi:hypothetical protein
MTRNAQRQPTSILEGDTENQHRHLNFDPYKEIHDKLKIDGENYLAWKINMR